MSEQAAASGLKEKILAKKWIIIGIVIIVLLGGVLWRYFTGDSQSTIITETPEKIYEDLSDLTADHLEEALEELEQIDFSLIE
ncbi:hypothetical protein J4456_05065 [Candidatus Pacearchaeota archaeon]|nr:hypothetical protein [Candidatus Pacearchaeota archaeon]